MRDIHNNIAHEVIEGMQGVASPSSEPSSMLYLICKCSVLRLHTRVLHLQIKYKCHECVITITHKKFEFEKGSRDCNKKSGNK